MPEISPSPATPAGVGFGIVNTVKRRDELSDLPPLNSLRGSR
jgi:hypothetical protein